jgi:hypothetical protein
MIPNCYPSPQSYIVSYPEKNIQGKVVTLHQVLIKGKLDKVESKLHKKNKELKKTDQK